MPEPRFFFCHCCGKRTDNPGLHICEQEERRVHEETIFRIMEWEQAEIREFLRRNFICNLAAYDEFCARRMAAARGSNVVIAITGGTNAE